MDPSAVRAAAVGLDDAMATALMALSRRVASDSPSGAGSRRDAGLFGRPSLSPRLRLVRRPPPLTSLTAWPSTARWSPPSSGFPWIIWMPEAENSRLKSSTTKCLDMADNLLAGLRGERPPNCLNCHGKQ